MKNNASGKLIPCLFIVIVIITVSVIPTGKIFAQAPAGVKTIVLQDNASLIQTKK